MKIYEGQASFRWNNETYDVGEAEAEVFHVWISQFFEEILNVDISVWPLHHRWQVVNEVLSAGLLKMNGSVLEMVSIEEVEVS